jgi:hypothetical protein
VKVVGLPTNKSCSLFAIQNIFVPHQNEGLYRRTRRAGSVGVIVGLCVQFCARLAPANVGSSPSRLPFRAIIVSIPHQQDVVATILGHGPGLDHDRIDGVQQYQGNFRVYRKSTRTVCFHGSIDAMAVTAYPFQVAIAYAAPLSLSFPIRATWVE